MKGEKRAENGRTRKEKMGALKKKGRPMDEPKKTPIKNKTARSKKYKNPFYKSMIN